MYMLTFLATYVRSMLQHSTCGQGSEEHLEGQLGAISFSTLQMVEKLEILVLHAFTLRITLLAGIHSTEF